jgi:ribose 5-phosphate isomerase B
MKIAIASDHAGYELKQKLLPFLTEFGHEIQDFGPDTADFSVDYPDFASHVAKAIQTKQADLGVVICGTGIGMSIAANKHQGIRCALCHDCYTARVTREHNDSNMIALGARVIGEDLAKEIMKAFLAADFEGGRHQQRIDKMMALEK